MNGRIRRSVWLAALARLLTLCVLLAGCRDQVDAGSQATAGDEGTTSPSDDDADPDGPLATTRRIRAAVEAEGTGAAAFTWTGEEVITVVRAGRAGMDVNLLSGGFEEPRIVDSEPKNRFRWAFDLVNAYEEKPGTFTIEPAPEGQIGSMAFLIWLRAKDGTKPAVYEMDEVEFLKEFREILEPCRLEIGEQALNGSLTCSALRSAEGEVAGLRVAWRDGRVEDAD